MSATPSSGSIDGKIDAQDLLFSRVVGPALVPRIDIRIGDVASCFLGLGDCCPRASRGRQ